MTCKPGVVVAGGGVLGVSAAVPAVDVETDFCCSSLMHRAQLYEGARSGAEILCTSQMALHTRGVGPAGSTSAMVGVPGCCVVAQADGPSTAPPPPPPPYLPHALTLHATPTPAPLALPRSPYIEAYRG
ncbi:hypothetical protein O3P69_012108 [Scylla paramamosain]|uniref:Uncharacterized protein n=1 Tax=Scylla paramamosain TaxID=85552 RepID=A0AAW0TBP3_SCYPA